MTYISINNMYINKCTHINILYKLDIVFILLKGIEMINVVCIDFRKLHFYQRNSSSVLIIIDFIICI